MMSLNILIVEDEILIANHIKYELIKLNHKVIDIAVSGEDAINKALDLKPDVIFMDIILADHINGIQAAKAIQKESNIPVLYITASTDKGNYILASKTNMIGFLNKPVIEEELYSCLNTYIESLVQK